MNGKRKGIGLPFAWNGLKKVIINERNFRIHLIAALFVIIASFYFKITYIEWVIILLVIALVLVTEIINSALESFIDYMKPEIHPQAKIIKDMAAGSVLVAAIFALAIGAIIFIPKLYLSIINHL